MTTSSTRSPSATSTHSSPSSRTSTSRADVVLYRLDARPDRPPLDEATDARLDDLDRRIAAKERQLRRSRADPAGFERWLASRPKEPTVPGQVAAFAFETLDDKSARPHEGPARRGEVRACGRAGREDGFTFPGVGTSTRVDPFSFGLWVRTPAHAPEGRRAPPQPGPDRAGSRGYEILLEDGRVAVGLHHMWPGNSLKVATTEAIPIDAWTHLTVTYDGSSRASGVGVYINGKKAGLEVIRDGLVKDITYGGSEPDLALGYRSRDNGFKGRPGGRPARLSTGPSPPWRRPTSRDFRTCREAWDASDRRLLDYYVANASPDRGSARRELHALRREQSRLIDPSRGDGHEGASPAEARVPPEARGLRRPGRARERRHARLAPRVPDRSARNRLGLARWLLAPDHP